MDNCYYNNVGSNFTEWKMLSGREYNAGGVPRWGIFINPRNGRIIFLLRYSELAEPGNQTANETVTRSGFIRDHRPSSPQLRLRKTFDKVSKGAEGFIYNKA